MDGASQTLIDQGLLGALVVILLGVVAVLYRQIQALHQQRAADIERLIKALTDSTAAAATMARAVEQNNELNRQLVYGRTGGP